MLFCVQMKPPFAILLILLVFASTPAFNQNMKLDSLPESQIDIPIQVNLKPIYALAEKNVDTVFTSPNYPDGWVDADCATRYKYYFRRSPLRMTMTGTTLSLGFTGYYKIVGSTRACVNGVVLSPWTPECKCGFSEGDRRVNIGFNTTFSLLKNYTLLSKIVRTEPQALDKCTVCFWGQDITSIVMDGMKAELDLSKKIMEQTFGTVDLRPYLQQAWNTLNEPYAIPGIGYLTLHPKKLRMDNLSARNDMLNIQIGITATPVVTFDHPGQYGSAVPDLTTSGSKGGFNIHLEAALQYDSLSNVLTGFMKDKRIEISEGLISKHIVIEKATVSGDTIGNLRIKLDFSGSFDGTAYFFGKPHYNKDSNSIEVKDLQYDLDTRNLFLKGAKWLFNKKIINELNKYTQFPLTSYFDTAKLTMNDWLNKEWTKGIRGSGSISDLKLTALYAMPQHLLLRSNCVGNLAVTVTEIPMSF